MRRLQLERDEDSREETNRCVFLRGERKLLMELLEGGTTS